MLQLVFKIFAVSEKKIMTELVKQILYFVRLRWCLFLFKILSVCEKLYWSINKKQIIFCKAEVGLQLVFNYCVFEKNGIAKSIKDIPHFVRLWMISIWYSKYCLFVKSIMVIVWF